MPSSCDASIRWSVQASDLRERILRDLGSPCVTLLPLYFTFHPPLTDALYRSSGVYRAGQQANALGCASTLSSAAMVACLRAASATSVLNSLPSANYTWFPVVDGILITAQPPSLIGSHYGLKNHMPNPHFQRRGSLMR